MFLFGKKKKEPIDIKIATAYTFSVMVYKRRYGLKQKDAEDMAFKTVENIIIENRLNNFLKNLWRMKVA